jgi:tetratricopeptide (TPR) repeat protein
MSTAPTVAARARRTAFAAANAILFLGCAIGVVASLQSDRALPAPNLLVDGPAVSMRRMVIAKDYADAVRHLRAYEQVSNDRLPHEQLGVALFRLGPEARAAFAAALRDGGPGYAQGHLQLGLAYERAAEHAQAAAELEEAVRLSPRLAEAHNALGVALLNDGRAREAATHFRDAASQGYAPALENLEALQESAGAESP